MIEENRKISVGRYLQWPSSLNAKNMNWSFLNLFFLFSCCPQTCVRVLIFYLQLCPALQEGWNIYLVFLMWRQGYSRAQECRDVSVCADIPFPSKQQSFRQRSLMPRMSFLHRCRNCCPKVWWRGLVLCLSLFRLKQDSFPAVVKVKSIYCTEGFLIFCFFT